MQALSRLSSILGTTILALAAALGTGLPASAAGTTTFAPLSGCPMDAHRNVQIGGPGCGPRVQVDRSFTAGSGLGFITIASGATLTVPDTQDLQLDTAGISVAGTLQAGQAASPFRHRVTFNFTGDAPVAGGLKGLSVAAGGRLQLFGKTGVAKAPGSRAPSWTYLSRPAGPPALYGAGQGVGAPVSSDGATTLRLADAVDWKPDDWIVVAGTDFSPDSAEFVRIKSVNCGTGCTVTLHADTPLLNYHFGSSAPSQGTASFTDGVSKNYGVDERAEVGLISRNIRLTAAVPSTGSGTATAYGGEIMVMAGFAQVAIQGVEIEKFGKARLGSYPIHFHQAGTVPAGSVLVDSNSIHHSYNKCMTLHSTSGVTLSNNVCARAVGHLFYMEEGDENNNRIVNNLGIGAMSSAFSIPAGSITALASFWPGDYLARGHGPVSGNGYSGFNVPFNDEGSVIGTATTASGFWITTLTGNTITGNSVAGCQAFGRGFWILPAASAATGTGTFAHNRAHGCYAGFDTASDDGVTGAALYTPKGTCLAGASTGAPATCDVVAQLDNLTASRNRNRGIWVRASWYALHDARLATNRDSVSLVSSGGTEGSPPGEWLLLKDAVIVGLSANNVLRFGPCPYSGQNGFGGNAGCYEPVSGNGYPLPNWNFAGMMFYDGPARLEHVHFVNFNQDITPYLTTADLTYFNSFSAQNTIPCHAHPFVYEGDAAMGWFQSNENSYPPTQYVQDVSFYNVDLRHQVYTQNVELTCAPSPAKGGNFRDGDKFTVILDRDGSLTGFQVAPPGTQTTSLPRVTDTYPISLNNIPFLAGPDTADECHSTGQQDALLEGRPTSLISPYSYATLEFSALTPPCDGTSAGSANCANNNVMVFTKDQKDYGGALQFTDTAITSTSTSPHGVYQLNCGGSAVTGSAGVPGHACVALSGRNGNGVYEPKLVNGLGYTVGASAGMPSFVSLMYGDASVPGGISPTNPFSTRIGICYKNQGRAAPPASVFTVRKGSKSFSGPNGNPAPLAPFYQQLPCAGLDNVMCGVPSTHTVTITVSTGTATATVSNANCNRDLCPSAPFYGTSSPTAATPTLPRVTQTADLLDPTKCPHGECFFYDQASGLLFINMVQEQPNAGGKYSSPLGSCAGEKNGICAEDNFYSCPGGGCELYTISVSTASYSVGTGTASYSPSGPSDCTPYSGSTSYAQPYPTTLNRLAYGPGTATGTAVATTLSQTISGYPHQSLTNTPVGFCPVNKPGKPDWPPSPGGAALYVLSPPSGVTASVLGVTPITGLTPAQVPLASGTTYTFSATASTGCTTSTSNPSCSCQQFFTLNADGTSIQSAAPNCCGLGTGTIGLTNRTLAVGAAPYACPGPNPPPPPPPGSGFSVQLPANVTVTVSATGSSTATVTTQPPSSDFSLTPGQTYLFQATGSGCTGTAVCTCQQQITVNSGGTGFTSPSGSGHNCCGIGSSGGKAIPVGASPFACSGP
ncbi:MAG: G8 domain-containing protein [Ramlibacter sp.]|nr:G8 domain-containing protein [Ramlibacter sp.]